jgi:hypothetical protein
MPLVSTEEYHLAMHTTRLGFVSLAVALVVGVGAAGAQTGGSVGSRLLTVTGVAKMVSASSLTLELGENEMTFAVKPSTRLVGRGLSNDLVLRDRKLALSDIVKAGDRVTVVYSSSGWTRDAVAVRLVQRSLR